jgi:hypothetical protein
MKSLAGALALLPALLFFAPTAGASDWLQETKREGETTLDFAERRHDELSAQALRWRFQPYLVDVSIYHYEMPDGDNIVCLRGWVPNLIWPSIESIHFEFVCREL